ncbi:MAG: FIST C-terminal domain-containing protein [Clostridiales bacterium]|jgi:hypothetical protein|nr:FIST C-terminal domain-containing protein [Clostridiales bacterium]
MIKTLTAYTREIDDPEAAAAEILGQLDLPKNQLKNSLGLVSCFSEFADTGVLAALKDALPFEFIGSTTCLCGMAGQTDQVLLCLTVLTSDTVEFKTGWSDSVMTDTEAATATAYARAAAGQKGRPSLGFVYAPLILTISGDLMLTALDKASGGVPLFGSSALDHTMDYSTAQTIYNGGTARDRVAVALLYGEVNAEFDAVFVDADKIRRQKAIITGSKYNLLISVNNTNAVEYLLSIGLTRDQITNGLGVVPLTVGYEGGGKAVARAVYSTTRDGYAVCGGEMPVNATLGVGRIDYDDVVSTAEASARKMLAPDGAGALAFSCMARYLVLGARSQAEAEVFGAVACERGTPYQIMYSGGEICPVPDENGKLKNRFHNFSLVTCKIR